MDIKNIIEQIDDLFRKFNRDTNRFTVDYDEKEDGIYCHYVPYVNDCGFSVSDYLLYVCDTSQDNLQLLKDYLDKNRIKSRDECDWSVCWGWKE